MLCPACNEDVHPYGQFSVGKGTQYRCPKCNGGMPKPEEDVVSTGKGPVAVLPVAPPAPVAEPTVTTTAQDAKSATAPRVDVLALAKERLAETVIKVRAQKELSAVSIGADLHKHHNPAAQVIAPPTEPVGKAPVGEAFQR